MNREILLKFVEWTKLKVRIYISEEELPYFKEREIWWASLGANIGYEQDGKNEKFERPILILKKFNKDMLWILPLTSKNKTGKYYYQFEYNGEKYSIILSQIRTISSKRLLRKVRTFSEEEFEKVRNLVKEFL
ncbi:type II toxin-antitoxin system PemK/MazF family toxin [Patescibacteria group bacterium]